MKVSPSGSRLGVWWHGARPRTLGASVAPVVVGIAVAGRAVLWRSAAALAVGVALQVGVNYANDYFDGVRGVDTHERLGPPRLTQSGMASPRAVAVAALTCVGVAGVCGLALAAATSWWLIPIGAASMAALALYSGGPRPYASRGLGEVMVFLFFGTMATAGTAYVNAEHVSAAAWWASVPMGLLPVAILVANNLRDISTDEASGKRTLAVHLGDRRTRVLYRALIAASFASIVAGVLAELVREGSGLPMWALFALAAWPLAIKPMERVGKAQGRDLIPVLVGTSMLEMTFGAAFALGLWLAGVTAT